MLKLAIVGVGGYGAHHLQGFAALEQAGSVKVIAVADPLERALENARKVLPEARCHHDFRTLLDQGGVNAVVLATPIPLHQEMALEAIRRGYYVLLEKPAVPLYSQWADLLRADEGQRIAVAFQRISAPGLRIVREMIDRGTLGTLRSLSVAAVWPRTTRYYQRAEWAGQLEWKSRPVLDGPATNGLAHYVNDMMFLAGDRADLFGVPEKISGEVYRARRIPSYDTACLHGSFAGGTIFAAGFSHAGARTSQSRLRVEGSKGVIWVEQDGSLQSDEFDLPLFAAGEGRHEMWRNFVEFASGRLPRPNVRLRDVEGYTVATNLMFQSAGAIRAIPESHAHPATTENGGEVVEITEINALLGRAVKNHCSLAEAGAPWARAGEVIFARDFSEEKMRACLGTAEPLETGAFAAA